MTDDRCQMSDVREQKTEDRGQRTDVRCQRTDDRGQKAEDREQMLDDRLSCPSPQTMPHALSSLGHTSYALPNAHPDYTAPRNPTHVYPFLLNPAINSSISAGGGASKVICFPELGWVRPSCQACSNCRSADLSAAMIEAGWEDN